MATIIQQLTGTICEPCYALNTGIDSNYWDDDAETLAHCERAAIEWGELGHLILDTGDEPDSHFGSSCIVCVSPPYAGAVYDGTLTIFARA